MFDISNTLTWVDSLLILLNMILKFQQSLRFSFYTIVKKQIMCTLLDSNRYTHIDSSEYQSCRY